MRCHSIHILASALFCTMIHSCKSTQNDQSDVMAGKKDQSDVMAGKNKPLRGKFDDEGDRVLRDIECSGSVNKESGGNIVGNSTVYFKQVQEPGRQMAYWMWNNIQSEDKSSNDNIIQAGNILDKLGKRDLSLRRHFNCPDGFAFIYNKGSNTLKFRTQYGFGSGTLNRPCQIKDGVFTNCKYEKYE